MATARLNGAAIQLANLCRLVLAARDDILIAARDPEIHRC
jgi:hypothetical protein